MTIMPDCMSYSIMAYVSERLDQLIVTVILWRHNFFSSGYCTTHKLHISSAFLKIHFVSKINHQYKIEIKKLKH